MDEAEQLRQQLRDEAAWRAFVEDELAREAEKARVWQKRAEERAERIDRLVADRGLRDAAATFLRRRSVPPVRLPSEEVVTSVVAATLRPRSQAPPPAHPEIRALTVVGDSAVAALGDELDRREYANLGADAFRDVDLAIFDARGWADLEDQSEVLHWLGSPARPPALWVGEVPDMVASLLSERDAVVGESHGQFRRLPLAAWAGAAHESQLPREGIRGRWVVARGFEFLSTRKGVALALRRGGTDCEALALALAGVPVIDGEGRGAAGMPSPEVRLDIEGLGHGALVPPVVRRLAIRQRRHVAAGATAAHRVREILVALRVPHVDRTPRVGVLLASNRPGLVASQLLALGRQHRRPDEVQVALHGGATPPQRRAIAAAVADSGLEITLTCPAEAVPLGSVLNGLADAADADILAKIDDDDHYGPSHLLDAVAALRRTGADLVGKKAHYVYLSDEHRTWLLAPGEEDRWATEGIMGATFVWRRALVDTVQFTPRPRRVDSLYIRAAAAAGARLYAMPANDFAYIRNMTGGTNVAGSSFVRARGRDVGPGLPLEVIDV